MEQKVTQESALPQLNTQLREVFGIPEQEIQSYSPLTLAYLGDAVFEVVVRTVLLEEKSGSNGALFAHSLPYVSAVGQAKMAEGLLPLLTEEELAVYRRGKNAKPEHGAKNASAQEYHKATGLEALIGTLYLEGKTERILELIREGMSYAGEN